MQKRSKKGFTLAELLIVVAIIAVLVAIAVPLFVGSLQKAEKARDDANIRTVRGAAVVYLLDKTEGADDLWAEPTKGNIRAWKVDAKITSNGEITNLKVDLVENGVAANATDSSGYTTAGKVTKESGSFKIQLLLTEINVTDLTADK